MTSFLRIKIKTVRITGAINREKYFELKDDNGLKYLLDIAGGLKANAYTEERKLIESSLLQSVMINLKQI